jgi:hypothetical protein
MIILGFDPGGIGGFGWCAVESIANGRLLLRGSGLADHASGAVTAAVNSAEGFGEIKAAAIDSPLFWAADGDRDVDKVIRGAIRMMGAGNAGGTVQQVNSLRGACLTQGILAAHLLRVKLPAVRITESHPKALLWLLQIANSQRPVVEIDCSHLSGLVDFETSVRSDHERDAVLGAFAAWAMMSARQGWRNLYRHSESTFVPVFPVEYWMPIPD